MNKKLYRLRENRMIAGVCGGIAEYFNIDPTIIRIIWILFGFFTYGTGVIAYIIAIIVIPEVSPSSFENQQGSSTEGYKYGINLDSIKSRIVLGSALVLLGVFLIGRNFLPWLNFNILWPVILIVIGILIIFAGWRKK